MTGDWDDPNHWSTSSGGTPGTCIPTVQDSVFFDDKSFSMTGQTVTLTGDGNNNAYCLNMDWTGVTNNPTFAGASTLDLRIYGSLTFDAGMTVAYTSETYFHSTAAGNTLTSAGHAFGNHVYFDGIGGSWALQDALNIPGHNLYPQAGTLTTNSHDITASRIYSATTNNRTLNLGSSILTLTYNGGNAFYFNGTNMTINPGTSLLKFTAANGGMDYTSAGGVDFYDILGEAATGNCYVRNPGGTFHNITFNNNGNLYYGGTANIVTFNSSGTISNGAFVIDSVEFVGTALVNAVTGGHTFNYFLMQADGTINGSNTFNNLLELTEGHTYIFNDATTQTFYGDLVAVGTCFNPINIQSSTATPAIFHKDGSAITVTRVNLSNMSATGTATFTANESFNLGG